MKKEKVVMVCVIPVVILLLTGSYFYLNREPELQVREGYTEFRYSINNTSNCIIDKNISAVTVINNGEGNLNLTVNFKGTAPVGDCLEISFYLSVKVRMPSDIVPSGFKIEAQEMENSSSIVDFDESFNEYTNVTPWPSEKNRPGVWAPYTAYIGGTPRKCDFGMVTHISWRIMDPTVLKTHTLKIRAEILGFSRPIVSTIVFVIDTSALGGDEK